MDQGCFEQDSFFGQNAGGLDYLNFTNFHILKWILLLQIDTL